eukprot:10372235-Karenia_brevis.AAC.1
MARFSIAKDEFSHLYSTHDTNSLWQCWNHHMLWGFADAFRIMSEGTHVTPLTAKDLDLYGKFCTAK